MTDERSVQSGPDLEGLKAFADGTGQYPRPSDLQGIDRDNLGEDMRSRRWVADWVSRELLQLCFHECSIRDDELISMSRRIFGLNDRRYSYGVWLWGPDDHRPAFVDAWMADPGQEMIPMIRDRMYQLEWGRKRFRPEQEP